MDEHIPPHLKNAIGGLLGNEALTGDLDDEPAQALMAWGIANLYRIHDSHPDISSENFEEATYDAQRANRTMMRRIGLWVARKSEYTPEQNVEQLDRILDSVRTVYGNRFILDESEKSEFLERFVEDTPAVLIHALRAFIDHH